MYLSFTESYELAQICSWSGRVDCFVLRPQHLETELGLGEGMPLLLGQRQPWSSKP